MADMCFDITGRPRELLDSITSKERTDLTRFAYYRLKHFSMPVDWDKDLYQEATAAVVRGLDGIEGEGRKPNAWALKDKENFYKYLKGAIRSIAEGWARTWRNTHQKQHDSADIMYEVLMSPHRGKVEYLDLVIELFKRLHQRAPARLLPTSLRNSVISRAPLAAPRTMSLWGTLMFFHVSNPFHLLVLQAGSFRSLTMKINSGKTYTASGPRRSYRSFNSARSGGRAQNSMTSPVLMRRQDINPVVQFIALKGRKTVSTI